MLEPSGETGPRWLRGPLILLVIGGARTAGVGVVALLAVTGTVRLWHLVVVALLIGRGGVARRRAGGGRGARGGGVAFLLALRPVPLRRERSARDEHPVRASLIDLKDGFVYMVRTPWLLATLLFASVMVLLIMGPIEVLLPFVIKERAGGGPDDHAVVMAAFGFGGALASLGVASLRLPRRYLTTMNLHGAPGACRWSWWASPPTCG